MTSPLWQKASTMGNGKKLLIFGRVKCARFSSTTVPATLEVDDKVFRFTSRYEHEKRASLKDNK
jgi:hypothetical protein